MIEQYQRKDPGLLDKYKDGTHQKGYFCGVSSIGLKLRTFKDKIVIT